MFVRIVTSSWYYMCASVSRMASSCSWPMFAPALLSHLQDCGAYLRSAGIFENRSSSPFLLCVSRKTKTPQDLKNLQRPAKIFILSTFYANQTYFHKKVLHEEVSRKWPMRMYGGRAPFGQQQGVTTFGLPPFRWYATLKSKTPAETFPKFPSVLRVIDRPDRNSPMTAR